MITICVLSEAQKVIKVMTILLPMPEASRAAKAAVGWAKKATNQGRKR